MTPSLKPLPPSGGKVRDWGGVWVVGSLVASLAAAGYFFYGAYTMTGFGGYLMAIQMNIFGAANVKIAFLMAIVIVGAALLLGSSLVGWVSVKLFGVAAGPAAPAAVPSPKAAAALHVLLAAPKNGMSWKYVLVAGCFPLAVGALVASVLYFIDWRDQRQTVYDLDLSASQSTLPAGAKFAEIKGLVAVRYLAAYEERVGSVGDYDLQLFAPITAPGWTAADPVRFVLHRTTKQTSASSDVPLSRESLPESFRQRGLVIAPGKLSTALPVIIAQKFKSKGLTLAHAVMVVEWTDLPDHHVPATDYYWIALMVGVAFSAVTFFIVPIIKLGESWRGRRDRRRQLLANR